MVDIEVLQIIVEVDTSGAKIMTKEGSMGEDSGDDMSLTAQRNSKTWKWTTAALSSCRDTYWICADEYC
ncbi:hypothetical protein A0H81_14883 [Grifola frondosa]|uniref:Uncharacterized protein n=1 Tax=Grifola frondosa TaxID=5627 RepID=A0A1C7LKB3_GRIFR|nr:hypothetical protein A0H81_14883 [Grifola frondosa]